MNIVIFDKKNMNSTRYNGVKKIEETNNNTQFVLTLSDDTTKTYTFGDSAVFLMNDAAPIPVS